MKTNVMFLVSLSLLFLFASCACKMPKWIKVVPEEKDFLYASSFYQAKDLPATIKAAADAKARDEMAEQIQVKVENMIKMSQQLVGKESNTDVTSDVSKQISNLTLNFCKITERETCDKKGQTTWYSLAKLSISDLKTNAKEALKKQKVMEQLYMDDKLQKELDKEIEELDGKRENTK